MPVRLRREFCEDRDRETNCIVVPEITMAEENKIRDAADAVKGLAEVVPVYQDALQPAAKEVGTALQTVAKTVHIALAPVAALVWGYDKICDFVSTKVAEKLKDVPPKNIQTPKPNIAGPTLEALRYTGHEESLREMYANLLAASMNSQTASAAHPAFVEIIRQLVPDEAKLLAHICRVPRAPVIDLRVRDTSPGASGYKTALTNFSTLPYDAACEKPINGCNYIDNLCRLGLLAVEDSEYTASDAYDRAEQHSWVKALELQIGQVPNRKLEFGRKLARLTEFGRQFADVCLG
jgi:hypothetical protein